MNKDDNLAASGVDLGLQNRFWKGKKSPPKCKGKFPCAIVCYFTRDRVILSLILCCTLMHYLTFSSYQNKSCYFNLLRRRLACLRGRPTERL